ncbi:MAG: SAM-dependent methyltransferase [Halococcoides sp.]
MTLSIVGVGPGHPDHLTALARERLKCADAIYVADRYRAVLPAVSAEIVTSDRDRLVEQATASIERVRAGERVVHVSGGDPAVYGKSDLLAPIAARADVPVEIVPGVTAALGAAATVGAPFARDWASISLSSAREWATVEDRLVGAARGGFAIALYNVDANRSRALEVLREHRDPAVPVATVAGMARGTDPLGAIDRTIGRLGDPPSVDGGLLVIGTDDTDVITVDGQDLLVRSRRSR